MTRKMLIDAAHPEEVRVCVLENGVVEDFDFESSSRKPLRGNIYLARVTRVEPSLQAAFVEYGGNRHGFLAFNEIHPDYYQIPVSDRRVLQEADAEEAALAAELELEEHGDADAGDDEAGDADSAPAPDDAGAETDDDAGDDAGDDVENGASFADDDAAAETAEEIAAHSPEEEPSSDAADDQDADEQEDGAERGGGDDARKVRAAAFDSEPGEAVRRDYESDEERDIREDEASLRDEARFGAPGEDDPRGAATNGESRRSSRPELLERYREARRKRARLLRNYKIQEVIKRRQILLVQVVKEERGNKGAALTTYMSLAGRYCVLMPNTARGGGISRKIPVAADRKRLRRVVDELDVPAGMGLIIRTAGAKRTRAEIKRDYEYLIRQWGNIRSLTLQSIAPCLIYEEANLIKRAIRDLYDKDIELVVVEGENGYREAKDFMKMLMPSHAKNVQPYKEKTPLFLKYDVENQLDAMYQPVVRLRSGGYIVIHQTEALVAIDVNSGKATRERNIELTALKTNLEAAKEAARQCRLRDLAGLIVIDFIDMEEMKNNRTVEKRFKDALKSDRARLQVGRISNFGLLEMSRQRRRSGIVDGTTHACPACNGAGVVRSNETAALRILRAVEREALSGRAGVITARCSLDVTLYILNHKREWLRRIEADYGVSVEIAADPARVGDVFELEKLGAPRETAAPAPVVRADQAEAIETEADAEDAEEGAVEDRAMDSEDGSELRESDAAPRDESGRRRRRRRKRGRGDDAPGQRFDERRGDRGRVADASQTEVAAGEEQEETRDAPRADDEGGRKRRRRGRRGGRRNRSRQDGERVPSQAAGAANGAGVGADARPEDFAAAAPEPGQAPTGERIESPQTRVREPEPAPDQQRGEAPASPQGPSLHDPVERESREGKRGQARKGWWRRAIGE